MVDRRRGWETVRHHYHNDFSTKEMKMDKETQEAVEEQETTKMQLIALPPGIFNSVLGVLQELPHKTVANVMHQIQITQRAVEIDVPVVKQPKE